MRKGAPQSIWLIPPQNINPALVIVIDDVLRQTWLLARMTIAAAVALTLNKALFSYPSIQPPNMKMFALDDIPKFCMH